MIVKRSRVHYIYAALIGLLCLAAACNAAAAPANVPTPSPFPTYHYVQPTAGLLIATSALTEAATAVSTAALDPARVAQGQSRYAALACGSCHGDAGEGTPKGSALAGTKLSQDQFIDVLRTGGKMGNAHLYAVDRLSDPSGKNLYLYILSLSSNK